MKKLKFMLAAATAIGLASALQAVDPQFAGSTDFEDYEIGAVTNATDADYFALPASAEEGDYQIVAGVPDIDRPNNLPSWFTRGRNKVLQLEGGTDPLERYATEGGGLVDLTAKDVYVDTLVQFTVTPAGDTVTAQTGDKLMVFLQVDENGDTNLFAKAGFLVGENAVAGGTNYLLTVGNGVQINAGQWYRLTVKAIKDVSNGGEGVSILGFKVFVDGDECTAAAPYGGDDDDAYALFENGPYEQDVDNGKVLISILGSTGDAEDQKLKSVGFAGSGLVDDLVFTTLDPEVTVLSFTLGFDNTTHAFDAGVNYTFNGLGTPARVSAEGTTVWYGPGTNIVVTYNYSSSFTYSWSAGTTVSQNNGTDTITPVAGGSATLSATPAVTTVDFTFAGANLQKVLYTIGDVGTVCTGTVNVAISVNAGTVITVDGFIFDPWYVTAADSAVKVNDQLTINDNTNFTVTAVSTETDTIPSGTTLADVGIDGTTTGLTNADLDKVAKWAYACVGSNAASIDTVNEMRFSDSGEATNLTAEAYLLNTNATAEAVAQAKAEFAFTSFDPANPPTAAAFAGKGYNGTVTIQAASTLANGGDWDKMPVGVYAHFFKAVLTK